MARLKDIGPINAMFSVPVSIRLEVEDAEAGAVYGIQEAADSSAYGGGIHIDKENRLIVGVPPGYTNFEPKFELLQLDDNAEWHVIDSRTYKLWLRPAIIWQNSAPIRIDLPYSWASARARVFTQGKIFNAPPIFESKVARSFVLDAADLGMDLLEKNGGTAGPGRFALPTLGVIDDGGIGNLVRIEIARLNSEGAETGEIMRSGDILLMYGEDSQNYYANGVTSGFLGKPDAFGKRNAYTAVLQTYLAGEGQAAINFNVNATYGSGYQVTTQKLYSSGTGWPSYGPTAIRCLNIYNNFIMAGGSYNEDGSNYPFMVFSVDGGRTWNNQMTEDFRQGLYDGLPPIPCECIAIWSDTYLGYRFILHDGSAITTVAWPSKTVISTQDNDWTDCAASSANRDGSAVGLVMIQSGSSACNFTSIDGGETWELKEAWPDFTNAYCVDALDSELFYFSSGGRLQTWGTSSGWTTMFDDADYTITAIRAATPSVLVVAAHKDGGSSHRLGVSIDDGLTIDFANVDGYGAARVIGATSENCFFAINEYGSVLRVNEATVAEALAMLESKAVAGMWFGLDVSYPLPTCLASPRNFGSNGGREFVIGCDGNLSGPIITRDCGRTFSRCLPPRLISLKLNPTDMNNFGVGAVDWERVVSITLSATDAMNVSWGDSLQVQTGTAEATGRTFLYLNARGGWSHFTLEGEESKENEIVRTTYTAGGKVRGTFPTSTGFRSQWTGFLNTEQMEELIERILPSPYVYEWIGDPTNYYNGRWVLALFDAKKGETLLSRRVPQAMELRWRREEL